MKKSTLVVFLGLIGLLMLQCTPAKVVTPTPKVVAMKEVNFEGKWVINQSKSYIVFEPENKKVMVKSGCNFYHADYILQSQALLFTGVGKTENICSDDEQISEKLVKTVYFKRKNATTVALYDQLDQEVLTLSQ